MSINSAALSGRLTRDSELRSSKGGSAILTFGIAVNERRLDKQTGAWEDVPSYFDCVLFGNRAEKLADYLPKGTKVTVLGKLRQSSWEKDGQRRSKVEVVVDEIEFMSRRQQEHAPQPNYGPMPQMPVAQQDSGPYNAPQNVYQAPQQVQGMVDQAFRDAQRPSVADYHPEVYEDIPFD